MDQPFLGHKAPRPGRERLAWCPACWSSAGPLAPLTSRHKSSPDSFDYFQLRHVLETCPAVEQTRVILGIRAFLNDCLKAGRSRASAYKFYILGMDEIGNKVDLQTHLKRGASLHQLTDAWLETWEDPNAEV